jgi:hypothetical protein
LKVEGSGSTHPNNQPSTYNLLTPEDGSRRAI